MRLQLEKLYDGHFMTFQEAYDIMREIGEGRESNEVLASILTVFRMRPITAEEFAGFRSAMYDLSNQVTFDTDHSIDSCAGRCRIQSD